MKKMFSEEGCGLLGPVLDRSSDVLSEICLLAIRWTLVTLALCLFVMLIIVMAIRVQRNCRWQILITLSRILLQRGYREMR